MGSGILCGHVFVPGSSLSSYCLTRIGAGPWIACSVWDL